jgi:hypothetical protein
LSTNGAGTNTPILASVACAIGVDIPANLIIVLAVFSNVGVKGLLGRSTDVPTESAADAVEPFGVGAGDGREGILRGGNGDTVSLSELETALTIESTVGSGSWVARNNDAKGHGIGEDHGSEGESVRADGGEKDSRDIGVDEGTTSWQRVCCRTSWGRKNTTISLHNSEELVVAIQLEVGNVGRRATIDDELIENLKLLRLLELGRVKSSSAAVVAVDSTGESHTKVDLHTVITHDSVEVLLVLLEFKCRHEAEAAETEWEHGRDNSLEEPWCEKDSAITAESQDEVKLLRLAPAQIGCPVLEHVLEARVLGKQTRCIEASRVTELSINVYINAEVGTVAWGSQQPTSKLTGEVDQLIVACLCDNHDVANGALDRTALKLLGDFANTSCSRNEARMRHGNIVLDLLENLADIDSISKALVVEAWRLESWGKNGSCGIRSSCVVAGGWSVSASSSGC